MRITYLDLPDDLAAAAGQLWPDSTWAELIEHAIGLLIADTRRANTAMSDTTAIDIEDLIGLGDAPAPAPADLAGMDDTP